MSQSNRRAQELPNPKAKARNNPAPPLPKAEPLKPRRVLFIVISLIFAGWLAFLLVLYFTTVHGHV